MPSIFTSASSSRGGLSRVNSFKRDWGCDENPQSSAPEIEWSPSPERVKRKQLASVSESSIMGSGQETPAERRRRAILEAMSQNTPSLSIASSASSVASSSRLPMPAAAQSLPELPTLSKKRQLPWEEDFTSAKRMLEKEPKSRSKTALPMINIRQKLVLSSEQQKVLQLVVEQGKNVFFTGSAGTGKSVLLKEIIKALQVKHSKTPEAVAVTASTGIAACNIGGVTLHSFGGVGLAFEDAPELVKKIKRNKKAASRWTRTKVLIIDEVSMVDGSLFDKFNKIGQLMRKRPGVPFGGIQVVVTGDFFQLPPVTKGGAQPNFCFEAATWAETVNMSVNLNRVFRQKDSRFVEMLNEMRFGKLKPNSIATFKGLERKIVYDDDIEPTELFPRREDVDRANSARLTALNTDGYSYKAADAGQITDPVQREKMLQNFMAPTMLVLKEQAQVMLIKNVDETLVNGSMGRVIGFCHKMEYLTDASGQWRGRGYEADDVDDEAREKFRESLKAKIAPGAKPLPVVRFNVPGGSRDMLVEFDQFKTELPNGEVQVSRTQLPLILAWAMSIHKAQGQTLDRVKVDLNKVFEKGQAYVALSRATSLEGLEVKGFRADKVMAHRKVAIWSESLQDLN